MKFIFGCRTKTALSKYFTPKVIKMLSKYNFVMKIYESNNIVHSPFQSAMDITQPFNKISEFSLNSSF
jgi:hypothetical protein